MQIKLEGRQSNRDGLGALVRVVAGQRVVTKPHDGKSGYLSQSSMPLFFGLGAAEKVDRIEVDWPSGGRQVVTEDIELDGLVVIKEEPAAPAPE